MAHFEYHTLSTKFENLTGHRLGGGTVFYYIPNKLDIFPHVELPKPKHFHKKAEILNWCETQFGNNWIHNFDTYYFKNEEDATLFALRWA